MKTVLLLFSNLAILLSFSHAQHRFDCNENSCSAPENKCGVFDCESGRIVQNATECGCCPVCIKTLGEGEDCRTTYYGWGSDIAECGPGLKCSSETSGTKGKCVATECLLRKRKYKEKYERAEGGPELQVTFECDYFGKFEPSENSTSKTHVVCINDVLCFCVDENGKRIFGTDFANKTASFSSMNCNCSRDIQEFQEQKETEVENLPRCFPNGDYDPLQCVGNKCFCMDSVKTSSKNSKKKNYIDEVVNTTDIQKLSCYHDDWHHISRKTRCLLQREEEARLFKENRMIIGQDRTLCEWDGTYTPMQCRKGRCFCVKRNGERQNDKFVEKENGHLECGCLRDKEIISSYKREKTKNMKMFEKIHCNEHYTSNETVLWHQFIIDFMK